jgi:anti-sigma B factor antagonist
MASPIGPEYRDQVVRVVPETDDIESPFGSEHPIGVIRVVAETDDIIALSLEGDFDVLNAPDLDAETDGVLGGGWNLILDLSDATFIDSAVVNVLVRAERRAREHEQAVVLQVGTAAIVERVLDIVGIDQVLPRAHGREEAVRMLQHESVHSREQRAS